MAQKLTFMKLIWDRFFYFPDMGMFWDGRTAKHPGDEADFVNLVESVNEDIAKDPKHGGAHFATIFLRDNQVMGLSRDTLNSFHAKTYLMLAQPEFKGLSMPAISVWNPVQFVWINNHKVICEMYQDDKERMAEWMAYRYKGVPDTTVAAYEIYAPKGSLSLKDALKPPVIINPPADPGTDPIEPPVNPGVSWDGKIHIDCPHCGAKII
jgi:hypothetical protein